MLHFPHGFMGTPQPCTTFLAFLSISNQIVKGGKLFCTEKELTKIIISVSLVQIRSKLILFGEYAQYNRADSECSKR